MSLLKLLSVGHSLHRVRQEHTSHYRPSGAGALPKFVAQPRFASTTSTSVTGIPVVSPAPAHPAAISSRPSPSLPVVEEIASKVGIKGHAAPKRVTRSLGSGRVDEVRVLRNDLNESDLEVVQAPARSGPVRMPVESAGAAVSELELAGTAWSRWTARLFAAGRERV